MKYNCTKCHKQINEGEGRYNFPTGTRCSNCGSEINDILEIAEQLLEQYGEMAGYRPRITFS